MEQYKLLLKSNGQPNEYALRISDNAFVHTELNAEYIAWLAEGNEPLPAVEPEPPVAPQEPAPEPEVEPVSEVTPAPEPEVTPAPEQETPAPENVVDL
jgi:outer membrane biosynthesis protein TonB